MLGRAKLGLGGGEGVEGDEAHDDGVEQRVHDQLREEPPPVPDDE